MANVDNTASPDKNWVGSPPGDLVHHHSGQRTMSGEKNNGSVVDEPLKPGEVVNQANNPGLGRSSSGIVNNGVGAANALAQASVSLNPSTQSFETTYQPLELMNAQVGTIVIGERTAVPGTSTPGMVDNPQQQRQLQQPQQQRQPQQQSVESRILSVTGIDPSTPDAVILHEFECFGDIQSIYSEENVAHSSAQHVVIVYYDIRAARLAMTSSGTLWRGRRLSCRMLDEAVGRQAYNTPLTALYLVSLEYNGGVEYNAPNNGNGGNGGILDDIFCLLSAYGELKELRRDVHSRHDCCVAEFYDSRHASMAFRSLKSVEGLRSRLLVLDAWDIVGGAGLGGGHFQLPGGGHQPSQQQQQPMVHSASTPAWSNFNHPQQVYGGHFGVQRSSAQTLTQQSVDDVLTKNLSEMSLESMSVFGTQGHPSYSSLQQASLDQIWKEPGGNVNHPSHSSSPPAPSSLLFGGAGGGLSNHQNILAALQAQQRVALQTQHIQAQNSAAIQLALGSVGSVGSVGNIGGVASGRNPIGGSGQQMREPGRHQPQYGRVGTNVAMARRNHSDPALGGRLARNKMNPMAEAERRAHQDRMYGLNLNRVAMGEDKRTTLMIKNIPNKYTQKMLLALLEERFAGMYPFPFDFFYLPIDFKNKCNVGYAFINMTSPHAIPALVEDFHGKRWPKFNSEKVCAIAYGRIQGKLSLIQHFQNSSLLHEDKRCRPVLFSPSGEIEPFPIGPAALANFSLKQHASDLSGEGQSSSGAF